MKEIGIYLHIPFCKQKCAYCDFLSFAGKENKMTEYIECLQKEIEHVDIKGKKVTTIYIGGGTPSYLNLSLTEKLLFTIKKHFNPESKTDIEWTIEINPGTITKEKLELYKKVGINRLSIGLQETDNKLLQEIGRIHTYQDFKKAYQLAEEANFQNINVDLMIGLPEQTIANIEKSLDSLFTLNNVKHISLYSLIVEEGTLMEKKIQKGELILPSEELEREMYWKAKKELEKNGFYHYEISNFAKPGYEAKHNLNCWKQKEYIGLGLGAHSYFHNMRYSNTPDLKEYIEKIQHQDFNITEVHEIQIKEDQEKEFMLLGLRMLDGVSIQNFKSKFVENPLYLFRKELKKLTEEELIEITGDHIRLTDKGLDLANLVWEEFV